MKNNKKVDYNLFRDTISERSILASDLEELVGELSYDINPIGHYDNLKESMFTHGLEQIETIENKLKEIKQSYINCLKDEEL